MEYRLAEVVEATRRLLELPPRKRYSFLTPRCSTPS